MNEIYICCVVISCLFLRVRHCALLNVVQKEIMFVLHCRMAERGFEADKIVNEHLMTDTQ